MELGHVAVLSVLLTALPVRPAELPVPEGPRLREIVAAKYPSGNVFIGGTTGWQKLPRGAGVVLDREFHYVTPENDFKQVIVHPQPGVWNWEAADAWLPRCRQNGQTLRIHGPIGPQCSKWAMDDRRTAEELRLNLEEYLTALCRRTNGDPSVRWLDVVNETVLPDGTWHGPKPGVESWENPWPAIGHDGTHPLRPPLYLRMAFEIAGRHAPDKELIINQNGSMQPPMWETVKALVAYLRGEGLRVDGIGWQAHVDVGWEKVPHNLPRLHRLIEWAHGNALSFHVTENTVWLRKEKDCEAQAETFGAIVGALLSHRGTGVVTWNTWNLSDRDPWSRTRPYKGCLFADDFSPKPAYYAVQKALLDPPPILPPGNPERPPDP